MNDDENSSWQYKPGAGDGEVNSDTSSGDSSSTTPAKQSNESFSWTSVEYVEHDRDATWYITMLLLLAVITAVVYFVTKDFFAVGAIVAAVLIVSVYAHRKPHQVTYELTTRGLIVGQKQYPYSLFKSFSTYQEGQFSSLNLTPIKRLMVPVTAYFIPQDEQKITQLVGEHVPLKEHKPDSIDRIARRLRL